MLETATLLRFAPSENLKLHAYPFRLSVYRENFLLTPTSADEEPVFHFCVRVSLQRKEMCKPCYAHWIDAPHSNEAAGLRFEGEWLTLGGRPCELDIDQLLIVVGPGDALAPTRVSWIML